MKKEEKYSVIGVMSGTSLDGLDIIQCSFDFKKKWEYKNSKLKSFPTKKNDPDAKRCGKEDKEATETQITEAELVNFPQLTEFKKTLNNYNPKITWVKLPIESSSSEVESSSSSEAESSSDDDDNVPPLEVVTNIEEVNDDDDDDEDNVVLPLQVVTNVEEVDPIIKSIVIQRNIELKGDLKEIFEFVPILIESATASHVNYYYIDKDSVFTEKDIKISKLNDELEKYVEELQSNTTYIISPTNTTNEIQELIKTNFTELFMDDLYKNDLNRIKTIYSEFPLSEDSPFFIKDLIEESSTNNFGSCDKKTHNYGMAFDKQFKSKVVTNKFGAKTTMYFKKSFFG